MQRIEEPSYLLEMCPAETCCHAENQLETKEKMKAQVS